MPTSSTARRPRGAPSSFRASLLALLSLVLRSSASCRATPPTSWSWSWSSLSSSSVAAPPSVFFRVGRHRRAAFLVPCGRPTGPPPRRRPPPAPSSSSSSSLSSAPTPYDAAAAVVADDGGLAAARDRLVAVSSSLSSRSAGGGGVFVTSPADARKFRDEFVRFESLAAASAPSTSSDDARTMLLGDWKLVATANLPTRIGGRGDGCDGTKTTKGEGGATTKLDPIREAIRRSIRVIQRVRSVGDPSSGMIDRVDNVIAFAPPETLAGILPGELPLLGSTSSLAPTLDRILDFANPLKLKKAKVVLVHRAEVESTRPVLRMRIAWTSSVLNVAGTSQYLDPDGADVFGLNNVLGEFLNVGGHFDTPYVDGDVRLSRTSGPASEQLRVFLREGSAPPAPPSSSSSAGDDAGETATAIGGAREAGATGDPDATAVAIDDVVASADGGDGSAVEGVVASEDADDGDGAFDVSADDADDGSGDDGVAASGKIDEIDGAEAYGRDVAPEVISEAPPTDVETASATGVDAVDGENE